MELPINVMSCLLHVAFFILKYPLFRTFDSTVLQYLTVCTPMNKYGMAYSVAFKYPHSKTETFVQIPP